MGSALTVVGIFWLFGGVDGYFFESLFDIDNIEHVFVFEKGL